MKMRNLLIVPAAVAAAGLVLAACGQGSAPVGGAPTVTAAAAASTVTAGVAPAASSVSVSEAGELGEVLVGATGLTLYGFAKDVNGESTCVDACATAWPALIDDGSFTPPAGMDPALFTTIVRPDGSKQIKAGKWPLYFYAGDGSPGETNGQGVGGDWFVVSDDAKLVKQAPDPGADTGEAPTTAGQTDAPSKGEPGGAYQDQTDEGPYPTPTYETPATEPSYPPAPDAYQGETPDYGYGAGNAPAVQLADVANLGEVMVGANGHTLYAFTDDPAGQTTCYDACAKAWPPVTVSGNYTISDELQASGVSVIDRPDGTKQLVMGKWALYYYSGDGAPGEAYGQGIGGKWYTINAECKLVKTPV